VRLTLLGTTPRVAPGLWARAAWRAVESADRVVATDAATVAVLRAEGVDVEQVADLDAALGSLTSVTGPVSGSVVLVGDADDLAAFDGPLPQGTALLAAAYDLPGARLLDLVTVMDRLRVECPWDREQTHRSLATYLLEETYETLEAIDSGDPVHLQEELGDLLLQVAFHARIGSEQGSAGFDIDDVAVGIAEKLVYRHPHVFAGLEVADADEVDRNWETLKAAEKKRDSPLEGIPAALPALAYADKVLGRLTRAGVLPAGPPDAPETSGESLGEQVLALVATARAAGLDPEQELRDAVARLVSRAKA
jgi:XTP/dITP diphosphohydrolase